MRCIFVFWSKPYFYKKFNKGYNKEKNIKFEGLSLLDFEKSFIKLSSISASKYVGKSILYTDTIGYEYFKQNGLLEYYDEVDVDLLNYFDNTYDFNAGYFWTSAKTFVICKQTTPFIFCDLDFILQEEIKLNDLSRFDIVHNQWEMQRGKFYVSYEKLSKLNLPYFYKGMLYPNTSFLFVNNIECLKEYWKLHEKIILNKNIDYNDESIWLLADQGILPFVMRKLNLKVNSLENHTYIEDGERNSDKVNVGVIPYRIQYSNQQNITLKYHHVWLNKKNMLLNEKAANDFIQKSEQIINNINKSNTII